MAQVPLLTVFGDKTSFVLDLERKGDVYAIQIDVDFAGREVDEEIDAADMDRIVGDEPFVYQELLGLVIKTDGTQIMGTVSVGSGNERFSVDKAALKAALMG